MFLYTNTVLIVFNEKTSITIAPKHLEDIKTPTTVHIIFVSVKMRTFGNMYGAYLSHFMFLYGICSDHASLKQHELNRVQNIKQSYKIELERFLCDIVGILVI